MREELVVAAAAVGAALERPRSPRRHGWTQCEASQLPVSPGIEHTALSAGGKVRQGCGSLAAPGGTFVPSSFWPQCEAQASRSPEPGQLARSGVHPGEDAKEASLAKGGGGVVLPWPGAGWGLLLNCGELSAFGPRVARKPPHATEPLAPAALRLRRGSSSSNSSEQRGRDIGEAWSHRGPHSLFVLLTPALFLPFGSDSCHSHRSQELLKRSRATGIIHPVPFSPPPRIPGPQHSPSRRGDSLSASGSWAEFLASDPDATRSFVEGSCLAAAKARVDSRRLSPPPKPSVPLERTAHFACRVRSSPFALPQDRPASAQPLQSWPVRRGYRRVAVEISRGSFSTRSLSPKLDNPSFQGLVIALGFC